MYTWRGTEVKIKEMSKFRGFCFTDFECNLEFYKNLKYKYLILGEETCPTTNKKHYQGFIYFDNPRSIKSIIKDFKPRHIEITKGTPEENKKYCSKEKIILEEGELPQQGKRKDLEAIMKDIKEGMSIEEIADNNPNQWVIHRKAFNEYKQMKEAKRDWITECIFLWGKTGSGKTRKAVEDGAKILQMDGRFILNYDGEDTILFDDVDNTTFQSRSMLLQLTDRYAITIPIKGGQRNWKPRKIYFTSNYNPEDLFLFNEEEMKRRLTKVEHMIGT